MKKLLLLILVVLFIPIYFGTGCQKEAEYCWTCITEVTIYASPTTTSSTTTNIECGKTIKEIRAYEGAGTFSNYVNGVGTRSVTNCHK